MSSTPAYLHPVTFPFPGGDWFKTANFGVFIHWDHASQQGLEISWPLVATPPVPGATIGVQTVSIEQYQSSAATFNPTQFDPASIAKLISAAGATYAVFTTRHHAGFSMFHTQWSRFSIEHSPYGGDITKELVEALRSEGVRVGFYYSLSDWHHQSYPAFEEADKPYPQEHWPEAGLDEYIGSPLREDRRRRSSPAEWAKFQSYLVGQLTELLTNYGQIDLLWFDGEWERSVEEWDTRGLRALIKRLQPNVVINERLLGYGDYATPEQAMPTTIPDGPWELCLSIGEMWGWRPDDVNYKSSRSIVATLVEAVSRGGNLLLNIAPRGDGSLIPAQVERFAEITRWMATHKESVVGVSPTTGIDFYGPTTAKLGTIYLHLVMRPVEEVVVRGIPVRRVQGVRLLATGAELEYHVGLEVHGTSQDDHDPQGELRIAAPVASGALHDVIAIDIAP